MPKYIVCEENLKKLSAVWNSVGTTEEICLYTTQICCSTQLAHCENHVYMYNLQQPNTKLDRNKANS